LFRYRWTKGGKGWGSVFSVPGLRTKREKRWGKTGHETDWDEAKEKNKRGGGEKKMKNREGGTRRDKASWKGKRKARPLPAANKKGKGKFIIGT